MAALEALASLTEAMRRLDQSKALKARRYPAAFTRISAGELRCCW
jgi:hypothetical protein